MTTRSLAPRPGQAGFVLIGVIVFVLALTIIGLSLFSLSGYEAQFLQRSLDGEQAFQSAVGGIELAKFKLATSPFDLDSVSNLRGVENVVAAVAVQVDPISGQPDSLGTVDWNPDNPVSIRVTAEVNGQQRTIEGRFTPRVTQNYYQHLVTTPGGLQIRERDGPGDSLLHCPTVQLLGRVWDASGSDSTVWMNRLYTPLSQPLVRDAVGPPSDHDFILSKSSADAPPESGGEYKLAATAGVRYFRSPTTDVMGTFSLWDRTNIEPIVTVDGPAVWLFPQGVRFDYGLRIRGGAGGNPNDCLVIVAEPNGSSTGYDDPTVGMRFFGGLLAQIPVILVSRGTVVIQHYNNSTGKFDQPVGYSSAVDMSIFAGNVVLIGPSQASGNVMALNRVVGGALDLALGDLIQQGALPNITSTGDRELALIPGTWRASGQ